MLFTFDAVFRRSLMGDAQALLLRIDFFDIFLGPTEQ
jgi:hypothetical protein